MVWRIGGHRVVGVGYARAGQGWAGEANVGIEGNLGEGKIGVVGQCRICDWSVWYGRV